MSLLKKVIHLNFLISVSAGALYSSQSEHNTLLNLAETHQTLAELSPNRPRVTLTFDPQKFVNECLNSLEIPHDILLKDASTPDQLCWQTLFKIKNHYKTTDNDKYIHTYHVMAKFLLSKGVFSSKLSNASSKGRVYK